MPSPVFYFGQSMGDSEFYRCHYQICSKLLKEGFVLIIMGKNGTAEKE